MAFTVQVLARRFAFLLPNLVLLLPNPAEFGDSEQADRVEIHAERRGNTHVAGWRIYAEMEILDVFLHDIHSDFAKLYTAGHQYSRCALTIRKMRSTSVTSCNTSYKALLTTISRDCTPRQPSGRVCLTASSILSARSQSLLRLL